MPTTIQQLFNEFGITDYESVKWGANFNENRQGVYVVASSDNPKKHLGILDEPIFDETQIKNWINKIPNFQIDNTIVTIDKIKKRLTEFWLPDESILYIGKAPKRKNGSGISKRITEYFYTSIGNSGPHSGGQWLKTLKNINLFTVYYGFCTNPSEIEDKMLDFFMSNVSKNTIDKLYDKQLPIPFANIKFRKNKNHGFKNQRL